MTHPASHVSRGFLLFTALVTGAVVMALEIIGSRLLAPVFGNSLYVWGALIGVILAAMSSGYAFGGWMADRYTGGGVLAALLLGSGSWTFLVAWGNQPVLFEIEKLVQDPRWGPCLAATVLLAPPAFGLSGVLPAMLRLAVSDMAHMGFHAGRMIALSTVGSLAGTWGTAFFLLSWIGTQSLLTWLGIIQILLGLRWLITGTAARASIRLVAMGGSVIIGILPWFPIQRLNQPIYQEDSPYQQVRIRDDELFRYLILDRTFHATMWKADPAALFLPYSQLMVAALALTPEPKRALILGHGGGSIAKWLARQWPTLDVDVVEVDPAVVRMAEIYFDYHPSANHHVFVKDARAFLRSTDRTYDVIWIDAFARDMIPFHLTTVEFFALVRAHLAPEGIVAVNLASSGTEGDLARAASVVQTMKRSFPTIETFAVEGPWKTGMTLARNLIFFGGRPIETGSIDEIVNKITNMAMQRRVPIEAIALLSTHRTEPWPAGIELTDDFAPYDLLIGREQGAHQREDRGS
ncbi:fused MFS/spermidine synthase [Candidatus Nitrospira inopinata]|jgi:spermidine synthase|uniref:Polyamine aminopropyltransferase n=1 Tax=Candidatus Nitrospira inopinata TaxID=1715989 RepID=A0A0S4KTV2_9BACT|nr:fused MFS/spermidine synthase [Candidatus Nitrospira inopinata]CUQ65122.1 putative Spermidine synthase modulated with MFS-type transporter [Candidatus Nitrospira inopinata]